MTDLILLPHLKVASARVRYMDNTGVSPPTYSGDIRTAARGGDRLAGSLEFSPMAGSGSDRSALIGFLARLQNRQGRFYLTPAEKALIRKGSFTTGELLANNSFDNGATGWSSSTGEGTLSATERMLRVTRSGVGADLTVRASSVTTVSGAAYVARAFMYAGRGALDFRLRLGTSAGGAEISATAADITAQGMGTLAGTAAGTTTHYSILDGNSSRSTGNYQDIAYTSLSRCALVNGASQAGSALIIDALPTSTAGLILPGQFFEVITTRGSELKVCTSPVDGDSSGGGYLRFSPPLRASPADDSPIILHNPMGYFMSMSDVAEWMTEPGITRASIDIVEQN